MRWVIGIAVGSMLMVAGCYGREFCPRHLEYRVTQLGGELLKRVDFLSWVPADRGLFHLQGVALYGRHPSTETMLKGTGYRVWGSMEPVRVVERYDHGDWVACHYGGTDIQYVAQLPTDVLGCEFRSDSRFHCLQGARSEPEIGVTDAPSNEILILASQQACELGIDGIQAGRLESFQAKAFYVRPGVVEVSCVDDDGMTDKLQVEFASGEELGRWLVWGDTDDRYMPPWINLEPTTE